MEFPIHLSIIIAFVFLAITAFFMYRGYKRGFVSEALATVTVILASISAYVFSNILVDKITLVHIDVDIVEIEAIVNKAMNQVILFAIFFVLSYIVLRIIRHFLKKINDMKFVGSLNHVLGSALGFVKAMIMIVLCMLVIASPIFNNGSKVFEAGKLNIVDDIIMKIPVVGDVMKTFHEIESFRENPSGTFEEIIK